MLDALLRALPDSSGALALLDSRMPIPDGMPEGMQLKRVKPTVIERLKAERWLAETVGYGDIVLCFGNLPPILKLRGRVVVFLQNRCLIDNIRLDNLPLKLRVRITIERLWLYNRVNIVDEFVVQTPTMKRLLEARTQGRVPVRVLPFMADFNGYARRSSQTQERRRESCDFLYVASGEPYKNHHQLIEAWRLLAEEGLFPSLRLTLDEARFRTLCREIEEVRQRYRLKVTNMGVLSHGEVLALYKNVDALIYPSTLESFGLPLIEARQAGLPVLASELDYVRDVLDPEQTFDPESPMSIARAVKRFMGMEERPLPLMDAKKFIEHIAGKTE